MVSVNLFYSNIGDNRIANQTSQTYLPGTSDAVTSSATYSSDYNQVTSITDALNQTTTFTYDSLGNLQQIKDAQNKVLQFGTNAAGQLTQFTDARNKTTQFGYDGYDLSSITDPLNRSVILRTDAIGRTVSRTDPLNQRSISNIDNLDRVTSVIDTNNQSTGFGYDNNDNLTSVTDANSHSTQFAYDNRNAVTSKTDALNQGSSIVYDNEHRIKQSTDRKNQQTSYTYDSLNRLRTVTYADNSSITHSYDTGNRLTQLSDSTNGNIGFSYDKSGSGSSASSLTYLTDALGSTIRLTNATGDKVVDYSYDPYGNTRADAVIDNSFQYTGRENDGNGLYYYRARYYSPATHRFIAEDPIGLNGGINTYGYVEGNPVTLKDPLGLWAFGDPLPQGFVDFTAGFGDAASFGLSRHIRNLYGIQGVDYCSTSYAQGEGAGVVGSVGTLAAGGMAINIGLRAVGATSTLYHFTSAVGAASITADGTIMAGSGLYGSGVYATAINSGIWARISGAASIEAIIAIRGVNALATPWPGTFRILGHVFIH